MPPSTTLPTEESVAIPTNAPSVTQPADQPSPTPIPLALVVNGEPISQAAYDIALSNYLAAQTEDGPAEEAQRKVLDDLILQTLLAQAAAEAGFVVEQTALDERIANLTEAAGGAQALAAWQAANGYTPDLFRADLAQAIAAAWMRDQISASVPETVEQVRARHLLLSTQAEAQNVLAQLQAGTSFDIMLTIYDPISLGELGWFPQGYLRAAAIEEAAFSLEVGEFSGVIETELGFHIVQVTARAADRRLDPDAKLVLQQQVLRKWLQIRRDQSTIEIYVP